MRRVVALQPEKYLHHGLIKRDGARTELLAV